MAEPPLISIVMPARNAATTIREAMDSVRAQTIADWELIVIDDGSTDDSATIVAGLARSDDRIRLITGRGEGAAAARNRGLAEASGQWLAFLDADDWWVPEFLDRMLTALAPAPAGSIAYCAYRRVMPDGRMTEARIDDTLAKAPFETFARTCAVVTIHCLLMDRAMVAAAGGFDTSLVTCEDWDLWQRLSRAGAHWVMLDQPLCYYRQAPTSLTRRTRQMMVDGRRVIDRAFGPDPRVASPLPQFADGIARDSMGQTADQAYAWFALWCAVVGWSPDQAQPYDPAILAHLESEPHWVPAIADTIVQGLEVRTCAVRAELIGDWPVIGPQVQQAADAIAQGWGAPQRSIHLVNAAREILLGAAAVDQLPVVLAPIERVILDFERPRAIEVAPDTDRLIIDIRARALPAGRIMLGVLGSLSASRVAALVAEGIAPEALPRVITPGALTATLPAILGRLSRSRDWLDRGTIGRAWRQDAALRATRRHGSPDGHGAALKAMGAPDTRPDNPAILRNGTRRDLPLILYGPEFPLDLVSRHLSWLKERASTTLSLDAVAAHLRTGHRFPAHGVALAFAMSGMAAARDIRVLLDATGLNATFFLPPDRDDLRQEHPLIAHGLVLDDPEVPFTLDTAALARLLIAGRLRDNATALLAPRSGRDDRLAQLAADCGYNAVLTNRVGYVQLSGDPMHLPTITASDQWTVGQIHTILEYQR